MAARGPEPTGKKIIAINQKKYKETTREVDFGMCLDALLVIFLRLPTIQPFDRPTNQPTQPTNADTQAKQIRPSNQANTQTSADTQAKQTQAAHLSVPWHTQSQLI